MKVDPTKAAAALGTLQAGGVQVWERTQDTGGATVLGPHPRQPGETPPSKKQSRAREEPSHMGSQDPGE